MRVSPDAPALPATGAMLPAALALKTLALKTNVLELDIEALLYNKGKHGETMNAGQFARLASEYLLQYYDLTKAETTLKMSDSAGLFFNSINSFSSKALVTIGLLSAFAVDFAMFGGTATLLIAKSPFFYGMVAASLLTASLIGTAETKAARAAYTSAASALALAAAYQVASANPDYVASWAKGFASYDTAYNAVATKAAVADATKADLATQVKDLTHQVNFGGVGGKHVAIDGNVHNDYLIGDLAKAQAKLSAATADAARYTEELKAFGNERPSQRIGLIAATGYMGAWLTLAQLQVGNIIAKGPKWLKASREEAAILKAKRDMVRALEENPKRVLAKTSAVLEKMKEFYLAGVLETKGPDEATRLAKELFSDANLDKMNEEAATLFSAAIKKRETVLDDKALRSNLNGSGRSHEGAKGLAAQPA